MKFTLSLQNTQALEVHKNLALHKNLLNNEELLRLLKSLIIVNRDSKNISLNYNENFVSSDKEEICNMVRKLELVYKDLTSSYNNDKGFLNDVHISLKGLEPLLKSLKSNDKGSDKDQARGLNPSLLTNVVYFNLVMLALYITIIKIEKSKVILLEEDLYIDLKVLKTNVLKMINPVIKDRLRNKSIKVSINGFVGFDTEYEEDITKYLKNRLLSIQLACTTNLTIIVPQTSLKPLKSIVFLGNSPSG